MFLSPVSWVLLVILAEAGRVEVEGLVVTAVARPSPFGVSRPGAGAEYELELSVVAKAGVDSPIFDLAGPIQAVGVDGKPLTTPSRFRSGGTRAPSQDKWTVSLEFAQPPQKTLPAVEGTISVAASQWKTAKFDGAALKPNAVVPLEGGGSAKLIVFDLEDDQLEVRFRVTLLDSGTPKSPLSGARAVLSDANGKEIRLASGGSGFRGDGKSFDYTLRFRSEKPVAGGSPRSLRLEAPTAKGPWKTVRFRIPDVPVEEASAKRKLGR
jgi:hypothetical protein